MEQFDGGFRHAEGWDPRILEQFARLSDLCFAHPAADDTPVELVGNADDGLGHAHGVGHGLR